MVDSLAQSYHWTFDDIMNKTLPQLLALRFSADVNSRRSDEYYERKKKVDALREQREEEANAKDPFIPEFGKRMSEMTTPEVQAYHRLKMRQATARP